MSESDVVHHVAWICRVEAEEQSDRLCGVASSGAAGDGAALLIHKIGGAGAEVATRVWRSRRTRRWWRKGRVGMRDQTDFAE
jgi:hypothetical protein